MRRRIAAADRVDLAVSGDGVVVGFAEWLVPARSIGLVSPSAGMDVAAGTAAIPRRGSDPGPEPRARDEAELAATYVLPGWQRRGIGRAFHERALEAYAGRVRAMVLSVARENHPAIEFYRSLGYVERAAYVEELFGERTAELRMGLRLEAPGQAGPSRG